MKQPTIIHTSIKGNPLIEIVKKNNRLFGISYEGSSKSTSCIIHYGFKNDTVFLLEIIIQDYIKHYGITEAIEILIGKGIINNNNRQIITTF